MAFIFYSLSPLKPNKHLLLCFFSLYCLLCGTSCWITQENLFWAILSLFLLSLTPLVWLPRNSHFTVFWIFLPFASSGWFVIILAYFFFFTVWGKEIAPLSEKTFFFPFSVLFPVHTFWDFQNSWTFIIIFYPHCFDFIFQMK